MDDASLDALLDRPSTQSRAPVEVTRLATALAREVEERERRRATVKRNSIAAGVAAGLMSLGVGTAVALPGLQHWWLWVPENDVEFVFEDVQMNGGTWNCTTYVKVLTDGKTADESTTQRLFEARAWLQSIDPAAFEDEARDFLNEGVPPGMPDDQAHALAITRAVVLEMHQLGMVGGGVSVESGNDCHPVDE